MKTTFTPSFIKSAVIATTAMFSLSTSAQTAVTIFSEDFGTASSTKSELIEDHVWETNSSDMFSWTVDDESVDGINVRNNNESDYEGASGSGNLYFKGKATFTISGINTAGYEDIVLTFGVFGKNEGDINAMTLTINDGTTETTVSLADMNLDATAGTWSVATVSDIPATATLTLTFASTLDAADDGGIRLDDITITGIKATDDGDTDDGDDNGDDTDDGDDSDTGDGDTGDDDGEEDTAIGAVNAASSSIVIAGRTITALNGSAEVFSLSGCKVATIGNGCATELPQGGVYIVKTGSKTVKAMLK